MLKFQREPEKTKLSELDFDGFVSTSLPNERLLRRLFGVKRPLTIFDIGSCEGEDSIRYARLFPHSKIHAFEPIPANVSLIKDNIKKYNLESRIKVSGLALSDKKGTYDIHVSSGQPEGTKKSKKWDYGNKSSSLLPPYKIAEVTPWLSFREKKSIQTETLDAYCKMQKIPSIDLVHMDVQGAELMVLGGGSRMLQNTNAIWLEVEEVALYKDQPLRSDVEEFMQKHGFTCIVDTVDAVAGDQFYVANSFLENLSDYKTDDSVSVIIPTYNRAHLLEKAIESVLNQTVLPKKIEIIIVDDGSDDNTESIIRKINDERISYYKLAHTGKPAVARNYGASKATGSLLAFLDSDDEWIETKLQDQLPFFEDEKLALVYGQALEAPANKAGARTVVSDTEIVRGEDFAGLVKTNAISTSTVIMRKSIFDELGGFNETKTLDVEDYHLWLRLSIKKPLCISYCGTVVAKYIPQPDSIGRVDALMSAERVLAAHTMIAKDEHLNAEQAQLLEYSIIDDRKHIRYITHGEKHPVVSIVMSVYNGEPYLANALESILNQTFTDFEFIIVNDGSTDGTADMLRGYTDPRLYVINQVNQGLVSSLNTACQLASGRYIARMDADDISLPSRIEKQVQLFSSTPGLAIAGTYFAYIDQQNGPLGTSIVMPTKDVDIRRALYIVNPFAHGSTMYLRSAWEQLGGYTDSYGPTEDYELWTRLANIDGLKMANIPEVLYLYRINPEGISQQKSAVQAKFTKKIIDKQWTRPYVGKGVRELIKDGRYYLALHPTLGGDIFETYYNQQLHIMARLFKDRHFLTGLKQALAAFDLQPKRNRSLLFRSILGGLLRKLGVKK